MPWLPGAPTTAVDLTMATELPNSSCLAPSAAVSLASWAQVLPERVNTYAAPVPWLPSGAPTTAVDPDRATEIPKPSPVAASEVVSSACWDQVPPERVNTYAAPAGVWPLAPTSTVGPDRATERPKKVSGAPLEAVSSAC